MTLRSTVKPFGLLALIEAGGIEAFDLEPAEIAILASSHSGEDLHVRTLQGIYRRTGVSQASSPAASEGMPLDALTAARLARDGEKAGPIRHMCSGQHTVSLLLCRLKGWDPAEYWKPGIRRRSPIGRRSPRVRHDADEAPDGDRRLRRRDVRLPAARGRARVRDARRSRRPSRPTTRAAAGASAHDRPRRDARQPGADRRAPRPARHVADEGGAGPAGQQGRDGGAPRRGDPARTAERHPRDGGRRGWRSRSRTATATIAGPGRHRSRRSARRACSTAARCGSSLATTGPSAWIRTVASPPKRSPSSSWRRSAS